MARTDIHRPSAITPEEYYLVACLYTPKAGDGIIDFEALGYERLRLQAHMKDTGGTYAKHEHGGNCHVCGAWFIDHAVYYHHLTNSYLNIGFDCATKMDIGDARAFRDWRTARKSAYELKAGKAKAQHTLEEHELGRAWELFSTLSNDFDDNSENWKALFDGLSGSLLSRTQGNVHTLFDIVRRLIQYGNISEKQTEFVWTLIQRIDNAKETQAKWDAEKAAAKPAPTGRVDFEGVLVSKKIVEGYYGNQLKGVVKTDQGWKVWLTIPAAISETEVGDRVALRATLEVSDDDETFAFGKRPHARTL
jgi:hypothetical protein